MNKIKAIKVLINGQVQGIFTKEAYAEYRLQMSTGDFHAHKTKEVLIKETSQELTHLGDLLWEAQCDAYDSIWSSNTSCNFCK